MSERICLDKDKGHAGYSWVDAGVGAVLKKLEKWMTEKGFDSLDQFRGMIARMYGEDPASFERMQFMKNFSEIN